MGEIVGNLDEQWKWLHPNFLVPVSKGMSTNAIFFSVSTSTLGHSPKGGSKMLTSINLYWVGDVLTWNQDTREQIKQWSLVIGNCQWMAWLLSATCLHLAPFSCIWDWRLLLQKEQTTEEAFYRSNPLRIDPKENSEFTWFQNGNGINSFLGPPTHIRVVSRSSSILISKLGIQFCAIMMSQFWEYERANLSYFWITRLEARVFLYFHISRVALNLILAPFLSINHCCVS